MSLRGGPWAETDLRDQSGAMQNDLESLLLCAGGGEPPLFVVMADASETVEGLRVPGGFERSPVYAIRSRGDVRTIQGTAAAMVEIIRDLQPRGPYRLAAKGPSGLVAYEIATQLLGADESVEWLALVDADCLSWGERQRDREGSARVETGLRRAACDYEVPKSLLGVHLFTSPVTGGRADRGWGSVLRPERLRVSVTSGQGGEWLQGVLALLDGPRWPEAHGAPAVGEAHLVTIQVGARGAPPIFCLPGAGAGVADFVAFTAALGDGWRVQGFQARGMNGRALPHSTVEAAAKAYLQELRSAAPHGPVHLVGHSFGGWLALELALLLGAEGRQVASLTIVDSECPGGPREEYTRAAVLMRLGELYERAADRALDIRLGDLQVRDPESQLAYLHQRLVRGGLIPSRSEPGALRGPVAAFEAAIRTKYCPAGAFEGPARLVLVPDRGEDEAAATRRFANDVQGWRRYVPGLQFRRGGGNHVTVLKAPHVGGWANWLREVAATQNGLRFAERA